MMRQLKTKRDILLNEVKRTFKTIDDLAENSLDTKYESIQRVKDKLNVKVIQGVIVVDCRAPKGKEFDTKNHNGNSLMSSEKAFYVFGYGDCDKFTCPTSCSGIGDTRKSLATFIYAVRGAIKVFNELNRRYLADAKKPMALNGGGITYKPVMVEISNYGYSVIADKNIYCIPAHDFTLD